MSATTKATILCPHCQREHLARSRFCPRTSLALPQPSADAAEPPFQPRRLNEHYELIGVLGRGAQGCVYLARQAFLNREVAIKEVQCTTDQARVERELRAIGRLSHRNIVAAHQAFVIDGRTYLVMERAPGRSLRQLLGAPENGGRLAPREVLAIAATIAAALEHAHQMQIIHRDLKPENVVVPAEDDEELEQLKLVDFGVARPLDPEEPALTRAGQLVGTPCYMAPEQCEGQRALTGAVDVYALGVMIFEMSTGRLPFPQEDQLGLIFAHCNTAPPRLSDEPTLQALPLLPELSALVAAMMAKDAAARPTSHEVAERLSGLRQRALRRPRPSPGEDVTAPSPGGAAELAAPRGALPPTGAQAPTVLLPSRAAATAALPWRAAATELTAGARRERRLAQEQAQALTEELLALVVALAPRLALPPAATQAQARAQALHEEIIAVREQLRALYQRREQAQDAAARRGAKRREALFALMLQRHPGGPVCAEQLPTLERRIDEALRHQALAQQEEQAAIALLTSQLGEVRRWLSNREVELMPCVCDAAHAMAQASFPLLWLRRRGELLRLLEELEGLRACLVRGRPA